MPIFDRFLTLSPDLLAVADIRDGLLTRVNPAACRILGRSEAELLSLPFFELVHPDDRDDAVAATAAAVTAAAVGARQTDVRFEYRFLRKDGSHFWAEAHGTITPTRVCSTASRATSPSASKTRPHLPPPRPSGMRSSKASATPSTRSTPSGGSPTRMRERPRY